MNRIIKLLGLIIICQGVGLLGSIFTVSAIPTWYAALNKASFTPPNWVFGPVWTTLYLLMAISLFLILEKKLNKQRNFLIVLFSAQLFLNFLWSIIFFGLHQPALAFVEIIFLWISIALLIIDFWKYSKTASLLLVPYIVWVSIASMLNLFVVLLNP